MNWQKFIKKTLINKKIVKVTKKNIMIDGKKYSNVFVIHLDNGENITQFSDKKNSNHMIISNNAKLSV